MHERLLHKIDEALDNGVATRSSEEIGRCLAVCQRCDCWVDERCGEDDMCVKKARQVFFMRLTLVTLGCDKWSKRHEGD